MIKGEAVFHINGDEVTVSEQDGVLILSETTHFIENKSDKRIDFIVISQPTADNDRVLIDQN